MRLITKNHVKRINSILSAFAALMLCISLLLFVYLHPSRLNAQIQTEELLTNLKTNAPKQWTKYISALCNMEGHIDRKYEWTDEEGTRTQSNSYDIAYRFPWTACDSINTAVVTGKNYSFHLKKIERIWEIEDLVQFANNETKLQIPPITEEPAVDQSSLTISNQLGVGLQIVPNFVYLPSIWDKPEFEILSATSRNSEEETLIDVEFRFNVQPPHLYSWVAPIDKDFTIEGMLTLTSDYYLIRHSEIDCENYDENGKFTEHLIWDVDYNFSKEEVPVPTYSKYTSDGNGLKFTEVKHLDLHRTNKIDSSRFTLSHYGLPEPDFKDYQLTWFRLVLVFLGCVLIFYSVFSICCKRWTGFTRG